MALAKKGPFFAVSTKMPSHKKVLKIPANRRVQCIGVWTICGCWSADNLEDGFVPDYVVTSQGGSLEDAQMLVDVKLWRVRKGGFVFINFAEFNFTRAEVETRRREEAQRKQDWRNKKAAKAQVDDGNVPEDGHVSPTSVPSISIPIPIPNPISLKEEDGLGGNSPKQAPEFAPQACGRSHDPAKSCGACATARRDGKNTDAAVERENNRRQRAADAKARAERQAEADATEVDTEAGKRAIDKFKQAATKGSAS